MEILLKEFEKYQDYIKEAFGITIEKFINDVNSSIKNLTLYYSKLHPSYLNEGTVKLQCWYYFYLGKGNKSYLISEKDILWKITSSYIFNEIKNSLWK